MFAFTKTYEASPFLSIFFGHFFFLAYFVFVIKKRWWFSGSAFPFHVFFIHFLRFPRIRVLMLSSPFANGVGGWVGGWGEWYLRHQNNTFCSARVNNKWVFSLLTNKQGKNSPASSAPAKTEYHLRSLLVRVYFCRNSRAALFFLLGEWLAPRPPFFLASAAEPILTGECLPCVCIHVICISPKKVFFYRPHLKNSGWTQVWICVCVGGEFAVKLSRETFSEGSVERRKRFQVTYLQLPFT